MGYPGGQVDIAGLAKVGSNVTHAGDAFDKAFAAQADALASGSMVTGWATGTALADATEAWTMFVRNLAGQVRSFGAELSTAASDYQSADRAAADRLAAAGASPGHAGGPGRYGRAFQ